MFTLAPFIQLFLALGISVSMLFGGQITLAKPDYNNPIVFEDAGHPGDVEVQAKKQSNKDSDKKKKGPKTIAFAGDVTWKRGQTVIVADYTSAETSIKVVDATKKWQAALGRRLTLKYERRPSQFCEEESTVRPEQGEMAICLSNDRVGLSGSTEVIPETGTNRIAAVLIKLYGNDPDSERWRTWTVPHEMGHGFGFHHADDPTRSIMAPAYHSLETGPLADDLIGLTQMYGPKKVKKDKKH